MAEEQATKEEALSFKLKLQGKSVDLSGVLPLRVRDWRALQAQDITIGNIAQDLGVEKMYLLANYVLSKLKEPVSADDLFLDELSQVFRVIVRAESIERADRPT